LVSDWSSDVCSSDLGKSTPKLAELGIQNRLPVIGSLRLSAEAGLLMSYGVDLPHVTQRIATQVDRILKGARPGDLPFEEPTKFEIGRASCREGEEVQ